MRSEKIRVSREEACSGKYQSTFEHSELKDKHDGTSSYSVIEALVYYNDDGTINEEYTYSDQWKRKNKLCQYSEENNKKKEEDNKEKAKEGKTSKKKEGCLTKLWKAPFRLLWWLIKKALVILSLGLLSGFLNSDD